MDKKKVLIALILVGLLLGSLVVIVYASSCNFVGSKNSDVYHYPDCRYVKNIKSGNRICFDTPEDAIAKGYRPCKVCKPPSKSPSTPTPTPTPTSTPTPSPIPFPIHTPAPTPSLINWIERADTPTAGGYGEAVVSTSSYIYIARCMHASSTPYFWRYNLTTNSWDSMNISGLPAGAFRNGAALAWDNGSYIYALLGGRYSDADRCVFYRYSIPNDSWEELNDTPFAQGAGDALTWSGYDDQLFAFLGSEELGTVFACYNLSNSFWNTTLAFNWTCTDDGASLVWTGGEYLYALRGEYDETVPNGDFARYSIPNGTWADMSPIPESEGVGDGASLLWTKEYPDCIFALGGGSCLEDPGYNFYCYNISSNEWQQLESIPCPVGYYVGNRLGFANGHIYYWQGAPTSEKWICGGDAFYFFESNFELNKKPSAGHIVINEVELNPPGNDNYNSVIEWVELHNPTSISIDLNGWTLSTTGGSRTDTFKLFGSIKANGYYVFEHSRWLDNENDESLILRDVAGNEIDRTPMKNDDDNDHYSWQRYPNGKDTWKFRSSTKGSSNGG